MDNKFPNVGENLRLLRQEMGISLDKASKMTGVSKAMLGQIERGESSPTVSTLWKISSGFKINFTTLLSENTNTYEVIKKEEVEPIIEQKGNMKLYPIYPFSPQRRFELFIIELEENCTHVSSTHSHVLEEYVLVIEGKLDLNVDGKTYILESGHSIRFDGTLEHIYKNLNKGKTILHNIEVYR